MDKPILNKEAIRKKLAGIDPHRVLDENFKRAAVLMPLFVKDGRWNVLLTLRSANLPTHPHQISFPGGGLDAGENGIEAALRETEEEMGILSKDVEVLGRLDEIITVTGYRITPFVGVIPYPYTFRVSEEEIDEVIEIGLDEFLNPKIFRKDDTWSFRGKGYFVYYFNVGRHTVWGATAKILKQFLEVVMGWREPGGNSARGDAP